MNDNSSYQKVTELDKLWEQKPILGRASHKSDIEKWFEQVKIEIDKLQEKAKSYDGLFEAYDLDKRPDWLIVENWRKSHERMNQLDAGEPFMVLLNELREAKTQHRCDCYTLDTNRMHRKKAEDKLEAIREIIEPHHNDLLCSNSQHYYIIKKLLEALDNE